MIPSSQSRGPPRDQTARPTSDRAAPGAREHCLFQCLVRRSNRWLPSFHDALSRARASSAAGKEAKIRLRLSCAFSTHHLWTPSLLAFILKTRNPPMKACRLRCEAPNSYSTKAKHRVKLLDLSHLIPGPASSFSSSTSPGFDPSMNNASQTSWSKSSALVPHSCTQHLRNLPIEPGKPCACQHKALEAPRMMIERPKNRKQQSNMRKPQRKPQPEAAARKNRNLRPKT